MIRYTVLGGYLGVGKTTLVNHILRHNQGARIALLINDFGAINIDAALIESRNDGQINLANGCICCSLSDGFFEAIESLREMQPPPDHIIVEASGVADVHKLAQYGHGHGLQLGGIIVVVDAETIRAKAKDKYVGQTILRQLKAADLIVLNKVDLVAATDELSDWLQQTSEGASVVPAERCAVPLDVLLDLETRIPTNVELPEHEHYSSWTFSTEGAIAKDNARKFMAALGDEVIRAKGLIRCTDGSTLELQVVGKRRSLTTRSDSHPTQLVAIGLARNFSESTLNALVDRYLTAA